MAGTPLAGAIVWSRPWCILSRRLQRPGAALYGWTGICRLDGKLVVPISDEDLFPAENVKMNGVKYFGGQSRIMWSPTAPPSFPLQQRTVQHF